MTVFGATATIESTVVRDTMPQASDQLWGIGIEVESDLMNDERATATLRSSLIERNREMGVMVLGADATIEATVVRGTLPYAPDNAAGVGIGIGYGASATVRSSLVDQNLAVGISVLGADATIEATLVRATQPQASDQAFGRGIDVADASPEERSTATIRACIVAHNRDVGIMVMASDATIDGTLVRDTDVRALDGAFGDGVAVWSDEGSASAVLTSSRLEGSTRAGLSSFGGHVSLGATLLRCNPIDLDGEPYAEMPPVFEDLGGNACGCDDPSLACQAKSAGLSPPEALPNP